MTGWEQDGPSREQKMSGLNQKTAPHTLKLLTGGTLYTPQCVGKADLLFGNKVKILFLNIDKLDRKNLA